MLLQRLIQIRQFRRCGESMRRYVSMFRWEIWMRQGVCFRSLVRCECFVASLGAYSKGVNFSPPRPRGKDAGELQGANTFVSLPLLTQKGKVFYFQGYRKSCSMNN